MKDRPFTPEEFKTIYSQVPRLCIDLIVRTPHGIVLTKRSLPTWAGQWHLPGGMIFYKEMIPLATQRVALHEIGIEVTILKVLGYMEFPSEEKERGFGWSISIALLCDMKSGTLLTKSDEASDIKTFTELPQNTMSEHKIFLTEHWKEIFAK